MKELIGKTIEQITGLVQYSEEVCIYTKCGGEYMFYHEQNCCESVTLEDYDVDDIVGGLMLSAEEVNGEAEAPEYHDSFTWTFYKIKTSKGDLWMRWLGESNGYYSESVDFKCVNEENYN